MTDPRCSLVAVLLMLVVFGGVGTNAQSVSSLANGNIDGLLRDPTYVRRQINCVLDKKGQQCDRLGGQLKLAIPEVLNNNCARCTPQQAANARKLISFIQSNYPGVYQETVAKYKNRQG